MASYLSGFEHLEIQLEEIKTATNNFDDSKVIGVGGFGKVYKGELSYPEGKRKVAFKRLDRIHGQGDPEFFKEIRMLSCYKHKNLISLLGFSKKGDEMILIYEHASQGSLDRILNDANLRWPQRLKICLDAAKGLSFLHDPKGTQQRLLHCDIKSANILLDENLNAKVADFGLSKISPANQQYTLLVTSPVGTLGYCDPLYMVSYQLTKESDVYSFGVVLLEVLCGRVCYENTDRQPKILVPYWKKCCEQRKLDEIIFPDLMSHLNPNSLEIFVHIASQCLRESRGQRPTMSAVVENLKMTLNCQELLHFKPSEYEQIIQAADPPLIYRSNMELIQTLTKGVWVNNGKTMLSINEKGEICERIYIEACLKQIQYGRLEVPNTSENTRFPGGRCYTKYEEGLKVHVSAQFLFPRNPYSVNLVFRSVGLYMCRTLHYKLNGMPTCCMVYDTYKREGGWFVVPLYQFTNTRKTANFEIDFEVSLNGCKLQVAGFEFRPLEEKMLRDQGLEKYQDIIKAAAQPLFYKSLEELKELLSIGFHINNYRRWISLNENGEHSEMVSISHCLIPSEGGYRFHYTDCYSRFPRFHYTKEKGFEVHIRTQFLTPSIRYTVNLVLGMDKFSEKQKYVPLRYKLKGETETSIVYLATPTKDNLSFIAELYQFTSNGRTFDLEIVFEDHKHDLKVEGILFQPLDKVHEQVVEDEKLSDDLHWTFNEEYMYINLLKWFIDNGREGYSVDRNGKKCLKLSTRGVIRSDKLSFMPLPESRFGEVALIIRDRIKIEKEIKSHVLSPKTTYAIYLVYKLRQDQSNIEGLLRVTNSEGPDPDYPYIYLVSPPETPFIGQKLYQNTHNPLNIPKPISVPRQRKDGWMEVKVSQFQSPEFTKTVHMVSIYLMNPSYDDISGLIIESIEVRPIVGHSV